MRPHSRAGGRLLSGGCDKGGFMMLGIQDVWVWLAYALSILSAVLCVAWGVFNWNKDDSVREPEEEVRQWAAEENKVEDEL